MERDRFNDPYVPGKQGGQDMGAASRTILRFGAAAMGAIILLLFTALLVHIPVLLIRVGVQLLTATAKIKAPAE